MLSKNNVNLINKQILQVQCYRYDVPCPRGIYECKMVRTNIDFLNAICILRLRTKTLQSIQTKYVSLVEIDNSWFFFKLSTHVFITWQIDKILDMFLSFSVIVHEFGEKQCYHIYARTDVFNYLFNIWRRRLTNTNLLSSKSAENVVYLKSASRNKKHKCNEFVYTITLLQADNRFVLTDESHEWLDDFQAHR